MGREPGSWCTVYVTLKDAHSKTWHTLLHSWQPSRCWATRNVCCILKRCHLSWIKSESTSWAITAVLRIIFTFCNNSATCIFQNHSQVFFPCHFTVSRWHQAYLTNIKLINRILQISSDEELSLREIKWSQDYKVGPSGSGTKIWGFWSLSKEIIKHVWFSSHTRGSYTQREDSHHSPLNCLPDHFIHP